MDNNAEFVRYVTRAIKELSPGAQYYFESSDSEIESINWTVAMPQPSISEITQKVEELKTLDGLNAAKAQVVAALEERYRTAQAIRIVNGHTFIAPLWGSTFNTDLVKKVNDAREYGIANLIFPDINGALQVIEDVPYSEWKKFYDIAHVVSDQNFILKNRLLVQIQQAKSVGDLSQIDVDVFPEVQQIELEL